MIDETEVQFNDELHQYTVAAAVRVSVTQVLKDLGFINFDNVPPENLEAGRARGKAVHACCQFIEEGDLDWSTVHPSIWGWVEAFLRMKEETGWVSREREKVIFQPAYNYAGMMDGFGSMIKLGYEEVLPDYKTGIPQKAERYQTAGYALAIEKPYAVRCSIHLKKNGTYKIDWHRDHQDVAAWKAIVQTYHLKHRKD